MIMAIIMSGLHSNYLLPIIPILWLVGGARKKGDLLKWPDFYEEGFRSSYIYIFNQFFSDSDTGQVLTSNIDLKYVSYHDTFTLNNGKKYTNVKAFKILTGKYPLQPEYIYYARNVGVIKKELFSGVLN